MQQTVDAYLAYNEHEHLLVEPIAQWLATQGISAHFFARDKEYGKPVDNTSDMQHASTVIAFLGAAGWGINHLRLVELARKMGKPVFPVLIGDMNPGDDEMADGLFKHITWADARNGNLTPLEGLLPLIRSHGQQLGPEIETMMRDLVGGPDDRRRSSVDRIAKRPSFERGLIAARLHELLERHGVKTTTASASSSPDAYVEADAVVRSWLRVALIWCEPESARTRDLVMRDILPQAEPAGFARFWSLATVYELAVPYLHDVVQRAVKDPDRSVSFAARAVLAPEDPTVYDDLRRALTSGHHWTTRAVLQALRIVPVPEVVPEVCAFLDSGNLAEVPMYDVFCALATPPAADAAAPILRQRPGVEAVVDRVIEAASDANRTMTRYFAQFLAALDAVRSRTVLQTRTENAQARAAARRLLQALDAVAAAHVEPYRHRPGFAADTVDEHDDHLGIQSEVDTLAAIMMARDVTPPLAIGLFGEWGAGKSFFMTRMRKTVEALAKRPARQDASPYCENVVQITFNAWHYADTNLWASLVSAIFEKLAVHVFDGTPRERQQAALIAELATARAVTDEARAEEQRASVQLHSEEARLDALRKERLAGEQELAKFNPVYLVDLLGKDKALKKEAEQALQNLGIPAILDQVDDFKRAVADAGKLSNRTVAFLTVLSRDARSPLYACLFLAALVVVPVVAYVVHRYLAPDGLLFTTVSTALAELGALIVGAAGLVRRGMREVNTLLKPVMAAKKKADEQLAAIRALPGDKELAIAANVEVLKVKEEEARRRVADAAARVAATEARLRELNESRGLAHFIADRHDSADYRKHLGLVSLVRQDFEALAERLKEHSSPAGGGRKVERIVLYIDDLDRCPASQVVDVLQAVHLLLAYPLFVVVVGVDSRWLKNSLALHHKELGEAAGSPQHYLEKIFQIPYSLRPMTSGGYVKLVGDLMNGRPRTEAPVRSSAGSAASPAAAVVQGVAQAPGAITSATPAPAAPGSGVAPGNIPDHPDVAPATAPAPVQVEERALVIRPWEEEFAGTLYGLIPSPRAAKRLVNVYRVLKAGVGNGQLPDFEGNEEALGEFQVPLLLLAMQICDAAATVDWFHELMNEGARGDGIADALKRTAAGPGATPNRKRLMERIRDIVQDIRFPRDTALLVHWIPLVSRFTFETRSVV